jgi:hypothetical protein
MYGPNDCMQWPIEKKKKTSKLEWKKITIVLEAHDNNILT